MKFLELSLYAHYVRDAFGFHGQKEGTDMTVVFQINGQPFNVLNGESLFQIIELV